MRQSVWNIQTLQAIPNHLKKLNQGLTAPKITTPGTWTYGRYVFHPYVQLINCCFPHISISGFLLYFLISSYVSQIIKELCSFSTYSFHFHHLSFNGITQEAISPQNMIIQLAFLCRILFRSVLFSLIFYYYKRKTWKGKMMKATELAESSWYFFNFHQTFCASDVYRHK